MIMDWRAMAVLVAAGGLVLYLVQRKAKEAVKTVTEAINPASPENVANRAAEALYTAGQRVLTGESSGNSPGADLYNALAGERDAWTMNRTDELIKIAYTQGRKPSVLLAQGRARYEWNMQYAKWWRPGDSWATGELNGWKPGMEIDQ